MEKRFSRTVFLKYAYEEPEMGLFRAFLFSYGSSGILRDNLSTYPKKIDFKTLRKDQQKNIKRQFYNLTYELRKDGILSKKGVLTKIGIAYYKYLIKKQTLHSFPQSYEKVHDPSFTVLITYDIPESLKKHRQWFRCVLKNLDFEMLHKSVWIGQTRIPKDLLRDLNIKHLLEHIHILKISKLGTLKIF